MNPRIISSLLFLFILTFSLPAQNETDALRYSVFEYGSTARAMGSGGSLGALGADFSVLSINPAGMAWYRKSDFVISPGFAFVNTEALLTNDKTGGFRQENKTPFYLNNFGVVFASRPRRNPNWKTFNFGMGFNRLNNFNQRTVFAGRSPGSITDRFWELADGLSPEELDGFEAGPAFDAGALIEIDPDNRTYTTDFLNVPEVEVAKQQTIVSSGAINELVFSFAGNYKERIMFGATLGVPFVNFSEKKTYREEDTGSGPDGDVPFFENLKYDEELTTTGAGVNFKLGLIARPTQMLRIGVAVHSPTAFNLEDSFNSEITYVYNDNGLQEGNALSPDGLFNYDLSTPWRFIGSAGLIVNRAGFVTAEVEFVDYSSARLRFSDFVDDERIANESISSNLGSAMNIRLGGEFAYDIFRFRGGFGLHESPFVGDDVTNTSFSLGAGFRQESFYMDLAYRRRSIKETYIPYLSAGFPEQFVETNTVFNQLLVSLGFRF